MNDPEVNVIAPRPTDWKFSKVSNSRKAVAVERYLDSRAYPISGSSMLPDPPAISRVGLSY